jgi:hypothetical protein
MVIWLEIMTEIQNIQGRKVRGRGKRCKVVVKKRKRVQEEQGVAGRCLRTRKSKER